MNLEYEQLKERVDRLEEEVQKLRQIVGVQQDGVSVDAVPAEKIDIASKENLSTAFAEVSEKTVKTVIASGQKVVAVDAQGVKHRSGVVKFELNGIKYVAFSEDDLDEAAWETFDDTDEITVQYTDDILHPEAIVAGISYRMFGHADMGDNQSFSWRRVYNTQFQRYDFVKVPKDLEAAADTEDTQTVKMQAEDTSATGMQAEDAPSENTFAETAPAEKNEQSNPNRANTRQPANFEKALGMKWMGVFAAILIFIAFIIFGVSVYTILGDVMKVVILLIISGIFTGVGVHKLEQDNGRLPLWNIIAGCGIGGCYITFLLMNMVFHLIGDIVLCVLIVLWIAVTIFFAKKFSSVFYYVCYLGIVISTIICELNWSKALVGLIFYLVTTAALILARGYRDYRKNYFWSIQYPIAFLFFFINYGDFEWQAAVLWILLLAIVLVHPHIFRFEKESDYAVYTFAHVLPALFSISIFSLTIDFSYSATELNESVLAFGMAFTLLSVLINTALKFRGRNLYINVLFYISAVILPLLPYSNFYKNYLGFAVFFIPAFIYGFARGKNKYIAIGSVYMLIYQSDIIFCVDKEIICAVTGLAIFALIAGCFFRYVRWFRWYMLAFVSFYVYYLSDEMQVYNGGVVFLLLCLICLCINNENFTHGDKASNTLMQIYTLGVSLIGYSFLADYDENLIIAGNELYGTNVVYIIVIVLAQLILVALCHRYSYWYRLIPNRSVAGVASGTGYLLLVLAAAARINAANYVISLMLILLAIAFITVGFKYDLKAIRMYGLILSLICTVKLVFVDVNYESSIYYAFGLFLCGALCLIICWIYNRIEKKNTAIAEGEEIAK